VYGITEGGRQRLRERLAEPDVSDDREFLVRVAFCHHLAPADRLALFRRRRDELAARAEARHARGSGSGSDGRVTTYLRSLRERDTAALEADIAWLDRLIADEGDGTEASDDTEIATPAVAPKRRNRS
jgi:hypothetical protein